MTKIQKMGIFWLAFGAVALLRAIGATVGAFNRFPDVTPESVFATALIATVGVFAATRGIINLKANPANDR